MRPALWLSREPRGPFGLSAKTRASLARPARLGRRNAIVDLFPSRRQALVLPNHAP